MKPEHLGAICLAGAASIWGGLYVVSKIVLQVIPALELVWLRYIIALAALFAAGVCTGQCWRIKKRDLPLILTIGISGYFISIWAQFYGTYLSSAQMGAMITSATPAFMVVFAHILLKESITPHKILSVCLATIGVLLIVGIDQEGHAFRVGGLVLTLAAVTWALMSVLVKKVPAAYSPLLVTTYAILSATIVMTPLVGAQISPAQLPLLLKPAILCGVLYIGIVATAGAFLLWNKGLQLVDAARGGMYFFFQPLVGTLLGWLFLGEQVGLTFWLGALLILSGVFLVIRD